MKEKKRIIAMAGKGGTGKTTISSLLIKYLVENAFTPILAVDADANANLNELLGLDVPETLGGIRERMKNETPQGMTKSDFMEMEINKAIIEATGFDLLVMGQPTGPGCYCMANSILAGVMDRLSGSYKFMLVDNEAGMEHLSRLNLRKLEMLFVVSDPSARGVMTAARIAELTKALGVEVGGKVLIVNRAPEIMPEALIEKIAETVHQTDLVFGGIVPMSQEIFEAEAKRQSLLNLSPETHAVQAAFEIFRRHIK